jgi:hypothetical protein
MACALAPAPARATLIDRESFLRWHMLEAEIDVLTTGATLASCLDLSRHSFSYIIACEQAFLNSITQPRRKLGAEFVGGRPMLHISCAAPLDQQSFRAASSLQNRRDIRATKPAFAGYPVIPSIFIIHSIMAESRAAPAPPAPGSAGPRG